MLCRKARQRLERHRLRRQFRRTFDASIAHACARRQIERTWSSAARIMGALSAAIEETHQ